MIGCGASARDLRANPGRGARSAEGGPRAARGRLAVGADVTAAVGSQARRAARLQVSLGC